MTFASVAHRKRPKGMHRRLPVASWQGMCAAACEDGGQLYFTECLRGQAGLTSCQDAASSIC